ncbi:SDR family NAD(P)-dependent oxidoreductase [Antarcticibacterium arcticum]|uniref:SDR family NAD(P)-dependent oxidoreductase n=1 Tax=Antarcticibacterium arcticum TaxID=2585771 RepID=A0A5B8YLV5_9FLAO|nr:NAD(P)H-binding protein [Antarcticibacterium arcticum]QED38704.1 SDR family NAD(P)-dependent oxidoreductase [Antarcticibacterium arcticum]
MNISVLGCGWLGLPLAKRLLEEGHTVKGSTTSMDKMSRLTAEGVIPYKIKVYEEGVQGDLTSFLSDAEILIIDIPPGTRKDPEANFAGKTGRITEYLDRSSVKQVIFISSTSVYEDGVDIPEYNEEDAPNATAANSLQLRGAETLLKKSGINVLSIIRFGGLFGPGRHPVKYLSGRKDISNPEAPVNLIHLEDCIGIIMAVISSGSQGVFLGVHPDHPSKKEYYTAVARAKNLPVPEFDHSTPSKGKLIKALRLEEELGYVFSKSLLD